MSNVLKVTPETSAKVANLGLVCALLVVVIHSELPVLPISALQHLVSLVVSCAVPLFFVFSGFFLSRHFNERGWYARAVKSRIVSLALPYVLWLAVGYVALVVGVGERSALAGNGLSVRGAGGMGVRWFGLHPFYAPGIVPLWYLRSLMMLVLLSPLIKFLVERLGWAWLLFLFAVDAYVQSLNYAEVLTETPGWGPFWFYFLSPNAFLFFSIGCAIGSGRAVSVLRHASSSWRVLDVLAVLVVLPACLGGFGPAIAAPLDILAIFVVMAVLWKLSPPQKWPVALVSLSFPIFLMHAIVFEFWRPLRDYCGFRRFPCWNSLALFVLGVGMPAVSGLLLRRLAPRLSSVLFGGR